jgi:ribonuclease HI
LPGGTNNQAELEAVRQVLLAMKRDGVSITIHTDSNYVIGVLAHQWKPKQNVALIHDIKALMQKHTVRFEKVAGHAGVALNERADALAKAAVPAQA